MLLTKVKEWSTKDPGTSSRIDCFMSGLDGDVIQTLLSDSAIVIIYVEWYDKVPSEHEGERLLIKAIHSKKENDSIKQGGNDGS